MDKLPAVGIAMLVSGLGGLYRTLPELLIDERVIEKDRIAVVETYGILPKQAVFEWNGRYAIITYHGEDVFIPLAVIVLQRTEPATLVMRGVCDNEVHMVCKGIDTEKARCITGGNKGAYDTLRKANETREELCDILDCAGICKEWQALQ